MSGDRPDSQRLIAEPHEEREPGRRSAGFARPSDVAPRGDATDLPLDVASRPGAVDPRILAAWHEWLSALATDAEAALAAAHVYAELAPDARDAWLEALVEDVPKLAVPTVAVYAPLLSVEADPARRARIEAAIGGDIGNVLNVRSTRAFRGTAPRGVRVIALVAPLYLEFVHVLTSRYSPYEGFAWVRHDPLLRRADAPGDGSMLDDIALEATPLKLVIDELAHAILAEQRRGGALPPSLSIFANLFDAHLDAETFP